MFNQILAYQIGDNLYLNITNRCPNRCSFCIRETSGVGYDLWLKQEPTARQVIEAAGDVGKYREVQGEFHNLQEGNIRDLAKSSLMWTNIPT